MSGYTADALIDRDGMGPDMTLLNKPFTLSHLLAKVREVLDKHRAA